MKKLIAILLFTVASSGSAAFLPMALSTTSVNGSTVAVVNANGAALIVNGSGVTQPVSGTVTATQGTAGASAWRVDFSTGVQVNQATGSTFRIDLSTGVQVNQATGSTFRVDFSTGVQVNGTVTANQGTAGLSAWKVDFSTGVQVNQASGATFRVDFTTGVRVNTTGGANLGVDFSTGVRVNTTGGANLGVDLSTGVQVRGDLSDNGAAATTNRIASLAGIYETNYNAGSAGTVGRNSAQSHGTDGLLWTANLPSFRPASYAASTNTITVAASATDFTAMCGNANTTVLLYSMRISCTETTAGNVNLSIFKRSTRFTGAWSTMTAVGMDSTYGLVTSSAVWFTANPTVGTLVGHLDNYKLGCMAPATATANDVYISPASWRMKPIILRGAGECVTGNLESQTVTGGAFTVSYEWIETTTITP